MACSKVTLLCIGLVAFAFLVGSGESKSAENTHHHKTPGTHHHHNGSPNQNHHHHKGPVHTHHHGGPGGGSPGAGGSPPGAGGSPPGADGSPPGAGGSPPGYDGQAPNGGGGAPDGGDGGNGGGLLGGVLGGGGGGLLGGLIGGGGGGESAEKGGGGGLLGRGNSPDLGPTGEAGVQAGYASRPDLAGPQYGIDDLQPTYCRDTPGYDDGTVKQLARAARDIGDGALDGAEGIITETDPGLHSLANRARNGGEDVLCRGESAVSDPISDVGTGTEYVKHGAVDALVGLGHPSKNVGPPVVKALTAGAGGAADETAKGFIDFFSNVGSGIEEGPKAVLNDPTSH